MSTTHAVSALRAAGPLEVAPNWTLPLSAFDQRQSRGLVAARRETMRRVVGKLKPALRLAGALDAGCGVGLLSQTLDECGLNVCAFDSRPENIAEARRRFPELAFETAELEERSIFQLGRFDFVVCSELLQRTENPFRAVRHLRELTDKCLLLENMCLPGAGSALLWREEPQGDGQGSGAAWCASESVLVKMLYRAGFLTVYRVTPLPNHEDFRETPEHLRRRTMLLASMVPIDLAGFRLCPEPHKEHDPWKKQPAAPLRLAQRVQQFLSASRRRQYITLALRARRIWRGMPIPLRLATGIWWLAERGALDHELMYESFEDAEMRFVRRFLRPGMTVVDVGAHHGLYTVLASRLVGKRGRVLALEPSPRERRRLKRHIRLNRCRNVMVEDCALADSNGEAELFVVDGYRDWGNSLRPPLVPEETQKLNVEVRRLDDVLAERGIERVDFVKVDAEGAELAVLQGAKRILQTGYRPGLLVEVQDLRTRPWGYAAREITQLLAGWNYRWFSVGELGDLRKTSPNQEAYDANLVALPEERVEEHLRRMGPAMPENKR